MRVMHKIIFGVISVCLHMGLLLSFLANSQISLIETQAGNTTFNIGHASASQAKVGQEATSLPLVPLETEKQALEMPLQPVRRQGGSHSFSENDLKYAETSVQKPAPKPAPVPKIVSKPAPKPVPKPVSKPAPKPAPKIVSKPVSKPAPKAKTSDRQNQKQDIFEKKKTQISGNLQRVKGGQKADPEGEKQALEGQKGRNIELGGQASETNYRGEVIAQLKRKKRYPRRAQKRRQTGTSTISFKLFANGMVGPVALVESSGYEILDKETVAMVTRSLPFKPFPADLHQKHIQFRIPVTFSLH